MLVNILNISQIVVSILLIVVVLLQNKNVSLNLTSMGWWMWTVTKRWPEKVLQNLTIILWVLFVLNSLAFFFVR